MTFDAAQRCLERRLVGESYGTVLVGDSWALSFLTSPDIWLVAQEIRSPADAAFESLLAESDPPVLDGVETEDIPTAIAVLRNRRKVVTKVELASDGALALFFDRGQQLVLTTTTDIVDWQWALNRNGGDPYRGFLVGCLWAGEIEVHDDPSGPGA